MAAGYSGLYEHSVLQIYDQSGSQTARQAGTHFEVREETGRQGGFYFISPQGQWLGGSQTEADRGGLRPEVQSDNSSSI